MIRRPPTLALLCGLVCLLLPASASAGPYQVRSCHADGVNAVWYPNGASGGAAYVECPGGVNGSQGLIVRNTFSSTPASAFSHARLSATAPPGTYFDGISFVGQVYANSNWQSGIYDSHRNTWVWCGPGCGTLPFWFGFNIGGFATLQLDMLTICGADRCSRNDMQGAVMLRDVTLRLQDVQNPSVSIVGGSLAFDGWNRGTRTVDVAGNDNTGVRTLRLLVDGIPKSEAMLGCDDHLLVPCPPAATRGLNVEVDRLPDGKHTLTAQAIDASGTASSSAREFLVDNTPPNAPQLHPPGSDAWQATNAFQVSWSNPAGDAGSPIAAAGYQICADAGTAVNCRPAQRVQGAGISALKALAMPAPGAWRVRVWLIDAAGNENPQTFREVVLRWDPEPPSIRWLPRSDDDPTRLVVKASDDVSGIASAEIEVRREAEASWHSLPVQLSDDGFSAVIDDEELPAGAYAIRARVRDGAGNEKSAEGPTVRLPVRLTTEVAVGKAKRLGANRAGSRQGRQVLIRKPRVGFGRSMKLTGRVTSPGGNPLSYRDVEVTQRLRLPGREWEPVATVRTRSSGRFEFKAPPGPSRLIRFRFPGTRTIRGTSSIVDLRVRATSSIRPNRRAVVNGEAVRFSGTVRGEPLPAVGKLLQLQVFSRGTWLTFATPRADGRGNWHHEYRFTATRGVTRYRFRVRVPREAGYPYEAGASKPVKVKVTGL